MAFLVSFRRPLQRRARTAAAVPAPTDSRSAPADGAAEKRPGCRSARGGPPEALIAGKPAVSYDVDGAREVVISAETGCLIPPRSKSVLSEAIARLATDPELRVRLGQAGRERFADLFRHERGTARIREVYPAVLTRRDLR